MSQPPPDLLAEFARMGLWPGPPYAFPALPIPWTIAVVASPGSDSAADVQAVLGHVPGIHLLWVPATVHHPAGLAHAIRSVSESPEALVLLVVRGGGDDLRAFNDRRVLIALVTAPTFTVLGVGHASDHILAGRVVDHEAITPTAAAAFIADQRRACPVNVLPKERS